MKFNKLFSAMILSGALVACSESTTKNETVEQPAVKAETAQESAPTLAADVQAAKDLLLAEWTGPFEGVPAFDKVELKGLIPALEEAMAMQLTEIDAIANNEAAATFENTIEAMEKSGEIINKVTSAFFNLNSADTNDEMQLIAQVNNASIFTFVG